MGQKAHPYGLRLGYIRPWKSRWFARKDYIKFLHEDIGIRKFIKEKWGFAGISDVEIERSGRRVRVIIHTARPGVIIGRRGAEIDKLRDEIGNLTSGEIFIDIKEIKLPQLEAQLVAENIAQQLAKRVSFRKAMKKSVQLSMGKGAQGIKVLCGGRLGGSEIARSEGYKEGKVPLNTFRADIDYGFAEAFTTYGTIGVKVWIYKGDVLVKKEAAEKAKERAQKTVEVPVPTAGGPATEPPALASGTHEPQPVSGGEETDKAGATEVPSAEGNPTVEGADSGKMGEPSPDAPRQEGGD